MFTFLNFDDQKSVLYLGDMFGRLNEYDFASSSTKTIYQGESPVTWYSQSDSIAVITEVGVLDPSKAVEGKLVLGKPSDTMTLQHSFYRPVNTMVQDLNKDGRLEMVVAEFGDETGQLTLLSNTDGLHFSKRTLLNQAGAIRTIAVDMDNDGRTDLVTIMSQGNEGVTILFQEDDLTFRADKVIAYEPVYGSSWFELVDYNNDGHLDIITVNGDNADKSYVHKPYHGMRIHLNDGKNNFRETFFYPLYGATRLVAHDFDEDGDIDFGLISSFPDYDESPEFSFVYLENMDSSSYSFETKVLPNPNLGRWFLMDKGDIDQDGDVDLVLSSFTYTFTPVPEELSAFWKQGNVDVLLLRNGLKD